MAMIENHSKSNRAHSITLYILAINDILIAVWRLVMLFVKEQKEQCNCLYKAHVWLKKHSIQSACFGDRESAEHWANWLQRRIVSDDLFRAFHRKL